MGETILITPREAEQEGPYKETTLANMRYRKVGPPYYKCRGKVLYDKQKFQEWITKKPIVTSDSE
jgi:hypothetical protein